MTTATSAAAAESAAPSGGTRSFRFANSIALPFGVTVATLLLLAMVAAGTIGRAGLDAPIPPTVLQYQQGLTVEIAQDVRRGLNEGVADLEQMAATTTADADGDALEDAGRIVLDVHDRYDVVYVVGPDGGVVAKVGEGRPAALPRPASPPRAGIAPIHRQPGSELPLIQQFAPLVGGRLVIGHYNPEFLKFALSAIVPGEAYLVNEGGAIVSASIGFLPFAALADRSMQRAAQVASGGGSGARATSRSARGNVITWAPVTGDGPGGQLGLSVVTSRAVGTFALPSTDARREGLVVAVLTAGITVALASWIWLVVLAPIRRLRLEAERVAHGDLSAPVTILRYDEIGLASRALDGLRVVLISGRAASGQKAGPFVGVTRGSSPVRKIAAGLGIVLGLAVFVVGLVVLSEFGSKTIDPASTTPATTSLSSPPPTPSPSAPPVPSGTQQVTVQIEPVSCEGTAQTVVYRAEVRHETRPVLVRLDMLLHRSDGSIVGEQRSDQVRVEANQSATITIRIPLAPGVSSDGAMCTVRSIEAVLA